MKAFYLGILFYLIPRLLFAFPEMILHGYSNCIACHVSPSGGGILTSYGQSLSKELLSLKTKTKKKSTKQQANSSLKENEEPQNLLYGADFRAVEVNINNEYQKGTKFHLMQAQGSLAYNDESWALVGTSGLNGKAGEYVQKFFPSIYGVLRWSDNWSLRAGTFLPTYGLNNSNHSLSTRGALGFGFEDQRPGVELGYLSEKFAVFLTAAGRRSTVPLGEPSEGVQIQISPTKNSKIAVNFWNEHNFRTLTGLWFVTPIYNKLYFMGDYSLQNAATSVKGYASFFKFGYAFTQGLNAYLMLDQSQENSQQSYTLKSKTGPGIQYFPGPNFEFDLAYLKETNKLFFTRTGDYAYLLLHYYL